MGFLALFLPSFRLDRCGVAGSQPAVLVAVSQGGERVLNASPAAEAQRVRAGMTLAEARSFCPTVSVERLDVDAELRDLGALAACLGRYSPDVSPVAPDCIVLGGKAALLEPVRQTILVLGHAVRCVWAPHRDCARANRWR